MKLNIAEKVKLKLSKKDKNEVEDQSRQDSGSLQMNLKIKMDLSESFDLMVKDITADGKRSGKSEEDIEEEILGSFEDNSYADYIKTEEIENKVYKEFKYSDELDLSIRDLYLSINVGSTSSVKNVEEARKRVEDAVIEIEANFSYSLNYELVDKIKKEIIKNLLAQ